MSTCKKYQNLFTDAFYQTLTEKRNEELQHHLKTCAKCKSQFESMQQLINSMPSQSRQEPSPEFWDNYWFKLKDRMDSEDILQKKQFSPKPEKSALFFPQWTVRLAGAVALLLVGFFAGYFYFSNQQPIIVDYQQSRQTSLEVNQAAMNYLERSKILLLGVVNYEPVNSPNSPIDFSHQRRISRELIQEASVIKSKLAPGENQPLQELIGDLEMILLQIANYEKEFDAPGISMITSGVENQAILLKINIEEMNLAVEKDQHDNSGSSEKKLKL